MFIARRARMDPKVIGQQWAKFLKQQVSLLRSQSSGDEDLANNPYYSKYSEKLMQAKQGAKSEVPKFDLKEEERRFSQNVCLAFNFWLSNGILLGSF